MAVLLFFRFPSVYFNVFGFSMCFSSLTFSDLFCGISLLSFVFHVISLSIYFYSRGLDLLCFPLSIYFYFRGLDLLCSALLGKEGRCYVYRIEETGRNGDRSKVVGIAGLQRPWRMWYIYFSEINLSFSFFGSSVRY